MKTQELIEETKISLIISVPIFLITYFSTKNIFLSLIIFLFLTVFVVFFSILSSNLGYKRHLKIIESDAFKKFISNGFTIEKVNKYRGINGVYRNYIFDIYYDWLTISNNKNYKALVLNVYFQPPKLNNNQPNHKLLETISEKYKVSRWSFKNYNFRWREGNIMMNNSLGLKNPKYEFITERMDILIDILKKENLQPVEKSKILEWRNETEFAHIPEIKIYYKKTFANSQDSLQLKAQHQRR